MKIFIKNFLPLSASLAAVALIVSFYTHFIQAQLYQVYPYLTGGSKDQNNVEQPINCPQLVKVEGVTGAPIIRDKCTNTYWYNIDLPLIPQGAATSTPAGYTWSEAKSYCEGIAHDPETGKPILRLPTSDELLSLVKTPCQVAFPGTDSGKSTCSPINAKGVFSASEKTLFGLDSSLVEPGPSSRTEAYYYVQNFAGPIYVFAEGSYWASNEIDINRDGTAEAAASVNLKYGMVNNPIFGKNIPLNVRCIYDFARDSAKFPAAQYDANLTSYDINSIQWWTEQAGACTSASFPSAGCASGDSSCKVKKMRLGFRANLQPTNGDVNRCPEGLNTQISGEFNLCTGVTPLVDKCVVFNCGGTKRPYKGATADTPIVCAP